MELREVNAKISPPFYQEPFAKFTSQSPSESETVVSQNVFTMANVNEKALCSILDYF